MVDWEYRLYDLASAWEERADLARNRDIVDPYAGHDIEARTIDSLADELRDEARRLGDLRQRGQGK